MPREFTRDNTRDYVSRRERPPRAAVPVYSEPGGGRGNAAGGVFSDPYTNMLEQLARGRIGQLSRPTQDPGLDEVLGLIRSQIGSASSATGPRAVSNGLLGDFIAQGRQRITELNQEPFSAPEETRLRTRALGNVEELRSAAKQRATEDAARRGLGETSGIIQDAYQTVDRNMDRNRTTAETDLAQFITTERQRRRSEATGISAQLAGAGAQDAALQSQNENARVGFEQARTGQIMQMAGMLADQAAQQRGEARANQNDILQIASMLAQLAPQRLAMAMNVLNGTGGNDANGVFNNTLNLSNMQSNQNNQNNAGTANMMGGLGQLLAYYAAQRGQKP